jgi:hypothetical protein
VNRSAGNSLPDEPRPVSAPDPELTLVAEVDDPPLLAPMDHPESDPQVLKQVILKVILGGVLIVAGWFVYAQFLGHATQRAFQTLAGTHTVTASSRKSVTLKPTLVFAAPEIAGPGTVVLAVRKQQALQAGNAMLIGAHR